MKVGVRRSHNSYIRPPLTRNTVAKRRGVHAPKRPKMVDTNQMQEQGEREVSQYRWIDFLVSVPPGSSAAVPDCVVPQPPGQPDHLQDLLLDISKLHRNIAVVQKESA